MIAESTPQEDIELVDLVVDEEDTGSSEITEPFNPSDIRIETRPMTIDLLVKRIEADEIDLLPEFQREGGLWKAREQSRLIESFLIRIPIPAFYMDATNDEKWLVVDGLQRLTALKRFVIDQQLRLEQLEFWRQFNGFHFLDLPRAMRRRIEESQITVYLIQPGTPEAVKFNIFKRINTGGLPLSSQEIRHALNQGPAAKLLRDLAGTEEFRQATSGGIRDRRMTDRECALRFLAFVIAPYDQYKSQDLDGFLHRQMQVLNRMGDDEREVLGRRFVRSMRIAYDLFGNDAFRKRYRATDSRKPINKALFEAWAVNLDALEDGEVRILVERRAQLREGFMRLMNDRDFDAAVTQGTGDVRKVGLRFGRIEELIGEVIR
jgi:Protein of unknown function DUF262